MSSSAPTKDEKDGARSGSGQTVFAGLILAGGEGRRWGGPKAWARLGDGTTFLAACARMLRQAGADPILATLPPGTALDAAPAAASDAASDIRGSERPRLSLLRLPEHGLDMFSSLLYGLEWLMDRVGWQAVVVLPVDHPLVRPQTVRELVGAGPPAAMPCWEGSRGHPVCLWRPVAARAVRRELGASSLRELLRAVDVVEVAVGDAGVRANLNRRSDLENAACLLSDRADWLRSGSGSE